MLPDTTTQLKNFFNQAVAEIGRRLEKNLAAPIDVRLERPKVAEHGDLATNIAMQIAKPWGICA